LQALRGEEFFVICSSLRFSLLIKKINIMQMKKFTKEELLQYNGKDGMPIYVGHNGKVYDLSKSFLWRNGYHQLFHQAGTDLTGEIKEAPHGAELLDQFPVVGICQSS
jgi:predicted heme/steroid binding protein